MSKYYRPRLWISALLHNPMQDITQIINASKVYATHKMSQKEIFSTLILNVQHMYKFISYKDI